MDSVEFIRSVNDTPVSMSTQQLARNLINSLHSLRIDAIDDQVQAGHTSALWKFPGAAILDILDLKAGHLTKRPAVYRFHRELGFSRTDSIKHSSSIMGLATAAVVLSVEKQGDQY